jgi:tetratricopeptide (TPR) repeat protein
MTDEPTTETDNLTGVAVSRGRPTESLGGLRPIWAAVLVAGLALALGWPTRHGQFLSGDDQQLVTDHVLVNHPSIAHAVNLLTVVHGDLYQPLAMLSLQANYAIASAEPDSRFGVSAFGFHLTNIALHVINAVLVFLVALSLSRRLLIALLTAAMFACHPFALEPVAWVSGRMILLTTTFALATMLICLRQSFRGVWPWLGGLAWLFSLMSKVLPSIPIAAAWCDWARGGRLDRRRWASYGVLMVMGLAATWLAVWSTGQAKFRAVEQMEHASSLPLRMVLAGRHYFENYVWPSRLAAWAPPPAQASWGSGATMLGLAEILAFVMLLWIARRRWRMSFVGLVLFVILMAPFLAASGARRLLAADRYMYLPMLGIHLAVAAAMAQVFDLLKRRVPDWLSRLLVGLPAVAVLSVWMMVAWGLAPTWADTVSRDRRVLEVYPDDVLAHSELARAYVFDRQPDEALAVVAKARLRWPDHPRLAAQAGEAYRLQRDWPQAEAELRRAIAGMPNHLRTQYDYAQTLESLGRTDEARARYRDILAEDDAFLPAAAALARSLVDAGAPEEAAAWFEKALRINPFHRESLFGLAMLRVGRWEWLDAERLLRRILSLDPADAPAKFHLAVVLSNSQREKEAIRIYDDLLAADEGNVAVRLNRAGALAAIGQTERADEDYRRILSVRPDHLDAALGLHELLFEQNRLDDVLRMWLDFTRSARRAGPSSAPEVQQANAYLAWAHALNDHMSEARRIIATIPDDAPDRAFADWVLIRDALRRQAWDELADLLGEPSALQEVAADRREQASVVVPAMLGLPESLRQSTAGRYTLVRLFLFYGDRANALAAACSLAREPPPDRWTQAADRVCRLKRAS